IRRGLRREPYVVTTGTGSDKSLTYLLPIYDAIARSGGHPRSNAGKAGVRAILVYPMNALINSQHDALKEYARRFPDSPVRFDQYTGQERDRPGQDGEGRRQQILDNPPHILLTNMVMLEYMMVRPAERVFTG